MFVKYLGVVLDSRLTWREYVDVKVRKAHNQLWACKRAYGATLGLTPKASPLALCLHHSAVHHFCIVSLVAWLSDGQCQENTKQITKTCMLSDNGRNAHCCYWCNGGTHWPPSIGSGDSGRGKVSCASSLGSGMLVLLLLI
jgi:hypothetical protein